MKVIIAGPRDFDYPTALVLMETAVRESGFDVTEVFSGCASGIDRAGERWSERQGIPVRRFPPDWKKHGKSAGPIRNDEMAKSADALLILKIKNRESRGTSSMISKAVESGIKVFVYEVALKGNPLVL